MRGTPSRKTLRNAGIAPRAAAVRPKVAVVGGGFAGLELIKRLNKGRFAIDLIDRNNYHTFQPLLYQLATCGVEAGSILFPLRKAIRGRDDVRFLLGELHSVDAKRKAIRGTFGEVAYDYLVIALGSETNFYGARYAGLCYPIKTAEDALKLRAHLLESLELATRSSGAAREAKTTFIVVGGGPTGVEVCGSLSEFQRFIVSSDYPELEGQVSIWLVESADRVLGAFSQRSSVYAREALEKFGVNVITDASIEHYDGDVASLSDGRTIRSSTVIWSAGVMAPRIEGLERESGKLEVDRYSRVLESPDIFAIGDISLMRSEGMPRGYPMLAPVAKQQARALAANLERIVEGREPEPFRYRDRGQLATIGRNRGVMEYAGLRATGFLAWCAWAIVHIFFLIGARNRLMVFIDWIWNYLTYDRSSRILLPFRRAHAEGAIKGDGHYR